MSIRRLTKVQRARRVLRRRRERCAAEVRSALRDFMDLAWPLWPYNERDIRIPAIEHVIRAASHHKKPAIATAKLDARQTRVLVARRKLNGSVRLQGETVYTPKGALDRDELLKTVSGIARRRSGRVLTVKPCGPCSPEELVAIDALLETGDRYAERLAKQCATGRGVFDGSQSRGARRR